MLKFYNITASHNISAMLFAIMFNHNLSITDRKFSLPPQMPFGHIIMPIIQTQCQMSEMINFVGAFS
jgi:hypothetical protein